MTTIVVIENWPNVIRWRNPFLKIGSVLSLPGKPGNEANKYHFQCIHTWLPVIALNYSRRSHGYVLYILLIASDSQRRPSSNLDLAVSNHWTSVNGSHLLVSKCMHSLHADFKIYSTCATVMSSNSGWTSTCSQLSSSLFRKSKSGLRWYLHSLLWGLASVSSLCHCTFWVPHMVIETTSAHKTQVQFWAIFELPHD